MGKRMSEAQRPAVSLWTLGTESGQVSRLSPLLGDGPMTATRVDQLRDALAAFDSAPLATLEAHSLPAALDLNHGMHLESASPLATQLADLISRSGQSPPGVVHHAADGGEMLYRMVVPAKVAAGVGRGLVRPMASKAVASGVHGALVGGRGIAAQATFVPVAAGAGAVVVAAPLVLLAVAAGISAYADHQRQAAIARITALLTKVHVDALNKERDKLDACVSPIASATAILLDRGQVGHSSGLTGAVTTIDNAIATATRRTNEWQTALKRMSRSRVEIERLCASFEGIQTRRGKFRIHLELAAVAIALRRRVLVLQAVEHAQLSDGNEFTNFSRFLKEEQASVDDLEVKIARVLADLGELRLGPPSAMKRPLITRGDYDTALRTVDRLRELKDLAANMTPQDGNLVIDTALKRDGSIVVFPATASA